MSAADGSAGHLHIANTSANFSVSVCSTAYCSCAAKDAEIARLTDELKAIKAPEKISAETLYQRIVGKLLGHWQSLYPMAEWIDPEHAAERMKAEIIEFRKRAVL